MDIPCNGGFDVHFVILYLLGRNYEDAFLNVSQTLNNDCCFPSNMKGHTSALSPGIQEITAFFNSEQLDPVSYTLIFQKEEKDRQFNMRSFIFLSALAFISVLTPKTATSTPTNTNALTQEHPPQDEGLIIDTFQNPTFNNLGLWHGAGEDLPIKYGTDHVRLFPSDPDHNYHTLISSAQSCSGLVSYKEKGMVLRVVFSGTDRFSISLNQHNRDCDSKTRPYPETWDSVEARRYIYTFPVAAGDDERKKEIYVPLDHFKIDHWRVSSVSFNGFYNTSSPTGDSQMSTTLTLYEVSIVTPPASFTPPPKLPTGNMVLRCTRPNSFAFGIDDGQPGLAREVMQILEEEGVLVTFFVVGAGLRDPETNFTGVYTEMLRRGHQVALHSWSHPK